MASSVTSLMCMGLTCWTPGTLAHQKSQQPGVHAGTLSRQQRCSGGSSCQRHRTILLDIFRGKEWSSLLAIFITWYLHGSMLCPCGEQVGQKRRTA